MFCGLSSGSSPGTTLTPAVLALSVVSVSGDAARFGAAPSWSTESTEASFAQSTAVSNS